MSDIHQASVLNHYLLMCEQRQCSSYRVVVGTARTNERSQVLCPTFCNVIAMGPEPEVRRILLFFVLMRVSTVRHCDSM